LGLVLKALQLSLFEPLDLISFKFLTYKCCFLLALATGRRISEFHALSVSESCIHFAADKSLDTLLTDPAFFFLAKNQLSEKGSGIIVIPALPNSGPTNLCLVHTLLKYLDTAFGVRSTVMLAYKSVGINYFTKKPG
jgi:hypothetical protein